MMIKIKDLKGWPPPYGGAFAEGDILSVPENQRIIRGTVNIYGTSIEFRAGVDGKEWRHVLETNDAGLASQIARLIRQNHGRSVEVLGNLSIERLRIRLRHIHLEGFKSIAQLDLDLTDRNILIGANGVGKSNLISFFSLLNWMTGGDLQNHVARSGGASSISHEGAKTESIKASLKFKTGQGENTYSFRLSLAAQNALIFTEEKFQYDRASDGRVFPWDLSPGRFESGLEDFAGKNQPASPTAGLVLRALRACAVYQFHDTSAASRIRQGWNVDDNRYLKSDAGNLPAFLWRLKHYEPEYYQRIVETMRQLAPFFQDYVLEPLNNRIQLQWREKASDVIFGAHQAADGLLRAMALTALLQQPENDLPAVVLIDEPELGLHPFALRIVAGLLRAASVHAQIIVATQSPVLLDNFDIADIIIVNRDAQNQRHSLFRRPDPEEYTEWFKDYSLGQLLDNNALLAGPA